MSRHIALYAECVRACRLRPVECDDTAYALTQADRVDLVVTGIRVPGPFDGLELVRRLRAHDATRRKPIIVPSGTLPRDQDAAREAGCSVFLPKPCLPDALILEVRRLLGAVSPSPSAPRRPPHAIVA